LKFLKLSTLKVRFNFSNVNFRRFFLLNSLEMSVDELRWELLGLVVLPFHLLEDKLVCFVLLVL